MDGIVIETTVTNPLTGLPLKGQSVADFLPPSSARKYINVLFNALVQGKMQFTDYTVMGETFVVLVEWIRGTDTFVAHEMPYAGSIHDIMFYLTVASENFKKTKI